jgi:hypothetical protein
VREEGDECVECLAEDVSHERGYAACDDGLCDCWEEEGEMESKSRVEVVLALEVGVGVKGRQPK